MKYYVIGNIPLNSNFPFSVMQSMLGSKNLSSFTNATAMTKMNHAA